MTPVHVLTVQGEPTAPLEACMGCGRETGRWVYPTDPNAVLQMFNQQYGVIVTGTHVWRLCDRCIGLYWQALSGDRELGVFVAKVASTFMRGAWPTDKPDRDTANVTVLHVHAAFMAQRLAAPIGPPKPWALVIADQLDRSSGRTIDLALVRLN